MRYRFTTNVNVEQVAHKAGSEFDEKDMPPGTLESLKRRKHVEKVEPETVKPAAKPEPPKAPPHPPAAAAQPHKK